MEANIIFKMQKNMISRKYIIQSQDIFKFVELAPFGATGEFIPTSKDSFTGRTKELKSIHSRLSKYKMCVISGLGGIGKTELAKKYASKYALDYEHRCIWINADTTYNLKESFKRIAMQWGLKVPRFDSSKLDTSLIQQVYRKVKQRKCLFIFDDARNRSMLRNYLPTKMGKEWQVHVLITSQNTGWGRMQPLHLLRLPLKVACLTITKCLGPHMDQLYWQADAWHLARLLHGFPLALQQAAAYIQDKIVHGPSQPLFTIKEYIKKYEQEEYLLEHRFEGGTVFPRYSEYINYNKTISLTVAICLRNIILHKNQLASDIIYTIAYFAPDNICKNIFVRLLDDNENEISARSKIDEALKIITKYSLVSLFNDLLLNIQGLVQNAIRTFLKRRKAEQIVLKKSLQLITEDTKDSSHWASVLKYAQKKILIHRFYLRECKEKQAFLFALVRNNFVKVFEDILKCDNDPKMFSSDIMQAGVMSGNIELVKLLLARGCSVACSDDFGPLLLLATKLRDVAMAAFLVQHGARLDDTNCWGDAAVHVAARAPALHMLRWLAERGADLNIINKYGECALKIAIDKEDVPAAQYLLQHGAQVNAAAADYRFQPLYWAVCTGNIGMVKLVVREGASLCTHNERVPAAVTRASLQVLLDKRACGFLSMVKTGAARSADYLVSFEMRKDISQKRYKDIIQFLLECAKNID